MRAFVQAAADSRYVALPQATARVAALQAGASSLVYDVLMLRVRRRHPVAGRRSQTVQTLTCDTASFPQWMPTVPSACRPCRDTLLRGWGWGVTLVRAQGAV